MRRTPIRLMLCAIASATLALAGPVAMAEDKAAARSQEQLRRLRAQVQQLQQAQQASAQNEQRLAQEKGALDEQLRRRSGEAGGLRKQLGEAEQARDALRTRLTALEQERDALAAKLAETGQALAALQAEQRDTAGKLGASERDAGSLRSTLAAEQAERSRCEANNLALYQHGRELMQLYENKGVVGALRQREPLFGMGQVKIENLLEEYRDKLDAQRRRPASSVEAQTAPAAGR